MFGRMGNIFSNFCNNKLYDYFILFNYVFLIFRYGKNKLKLRQYPSRQRSTVRSVITRGDKVHAYRAKIQSQFSRKQSLKQKICIRYFPFLFSRRITPFPLVPPVTNHPVYVFICLCFYTYISMPLYVYVYKPKKFLLYEAIEHPCCCYSLAVTCNGQKLQSFPFCLIFYSSSMY